VKSYDQQNQVIVNFPGCIVLLLTITSSCLQPNKYEKTAQNGHAVWTFQFWMMLLELVHSGVTETRMIGLPRGAVSLTSFLHECDKL